MYLHIGGDTAVPYSEIVAILNYEAVKFAYKDDKTLKSVIITSNKEKNKIFYSDISTKTLINRFECFLIKDVDKSVNGI